MPTVEAKTRKIEKSKGSSPSTGVSSGDVQTTAQTRRMPAYAASDSAPAMPLLGGIAQAKLTVGAPNDRYEQEADMIAQRVATGRQSPSVTKVSPGGSDQIAQRQEAKDDEEIPASSIQTKLTIGSPNDEYEQEADQVADRVMRMPDRETPGESAPPEEKEPLQVNRKIDQSPAVGALQIQTKCAACEEEKQIQPKLKFPPIPNLEKGPPEAASKPKPDSAK